MESNGRMNTDRQYSTNTDTYRQLVQMKGRLEICHGIHETFVIRHSSLFPFDRITHHAQ